MGGWFWAYATYEMFHYYSHFGHETGLWGLNFQKKWHGRHHYRQPYEGFGISNPMWDFIFGTTMTDLDKVKELKKQK